MVASSDKTALLADLDQAVDRFLVLAEGSGAGEREWSSAFSAHPELVEGAGGPTNDREESSWDLKQTLAHFLYYHQTAAWSIASVNVSGLPWRPPATADQINSACVPLYNDESIADLVTQLRLAHARLRKAVLTAKDPEAVVGYRGTGELMTLSGRLQMTANHWRGHLEALSPA